MHLCVEERCRAELHVGASCFGLVFVKRDCSGNSIAGIPLILVVFCSLEFVRASHTSDGTLHALEPPRATDPRRGVEGRRMRDLQRGGAAQLPGGDVHGGATRRCAA